MSGHSSSQEETDLTINKLSQTSSEAVHRLEESQQLQLEIKAGQRESLEYHRQLVENGSYLSQAIEASRGNVQEMMEEFKLSTLEQKDMIFEVFDRVSRLQNLVVSEVSWLYTVIFYSVSLLVIYLVTATKRTADARLWLFLLLTINFGLERLVSRFTLAYEGDSSSTDTSGLLNRRIWLLRNSTAVAAFMALTIIAARFKDYNKINNCLLEEIKKQNFEMRSRMDSFSLDQPDHSNRNDMLEALLAEDTGFDGDEEEEDWESDSDDSCDSTRTDVTYRPDCRDSPAKSVVLAPATHQPDRHSTYNFRTRGGKSLNFTDQNLEESPQTFSEQVKAAQRRQRRISMKIQIAQKAGLR